MSCEKNLVDVLVSINGFSLFVWKMKGPIRQMGVSVFKNGRIHGI
jgi:hypothetical protein